ncbi:MAG TPA: prephenate dehydrogenase/arogenate dehydrogenase family protein [Candidatus Limnocylindrales bacterium]|nr:prephenate dehydrogenase/arogenate dehydrogenase family protein [Candidatus Limnocylindrales bacterium]
MDRTAALARLPDRIAFLGLGLIGGSIALALRAAGSTARLVAWTPSLAGPEEALRAGAIDEVAVLPDAAIADAGLVILAGPPLEVVSVLASGRADGPWTSLARGAVVTDVASTKGRVGAAAIAGAVPFVGGHPMAGRETSGFAAATAALFVDRPWVIVEGPDSPGGAAELVEALALAVGARPVRMSAEAHDRAVASISHLPLVAAAALVDAVTTDAAGWGTAGPLAASGWRDMTRLARGDVDMGAGILDTNRGAVAAQLRAYRDAIDAWIEALESDADVAALRERLATARAALDGAREADG